MSKREKVEKKREGEKEREREATGCAWSGRDELS